MKDGWKPEGAEKDLQSITKDWEWHGRQLIHDVVLKPVKNVMKSAGYLTEIFRRDWALDDRPVDQVFQVVLNPGQISAWHAHERTWDRLFVTRGTLRIVLFDGRPDSPSHGIVNEFRLGSLRPALLVVPPELWHGVQNIGSNEASLLNLVDRAYQYSDPDHWRLPPDSAEIPYRW